MGGRKGLLCFPQLLLRQEMAAADLAAAAAEGQGVPQAEPEEVEGEQQQEVLALLSWEVQELHMFSQHGRSDPIQHQTEGANLEELGQEVQVQQVPPVQLNKTTRMISFATTYLHE